MKIADWLDSKWGGKILFFEKELHKFWWCSTEWVSRPLEKVTIFVILGDKNLIFHIHLLDSELSRFLYFVLLYFVLIWNWNCCTKLALSACWTQSVRASERYMYIMFLIKLSRKSGLKVDNTRLSLPCI